MATSKIEEYESAESRHKNDECVNAGRLVFTAQQAAIALQVDIKTIYRLVSRGKLQKLQAVRHLRIPKRSVENFLKKCSE